MINRNDFRDFLVINRKGRIIYADIGNPQYFGMEAESLRGRRLKDLFPELPASYPTMTAAAEGRGFDFFEMELTACTGITLKKTGCAYPIFYGDEPVGAIEFADFFYDREHIGEISGHAGHLIYRKNNTKYLLDDIISEDKSILELKDKIEKYAISDSTVLIYGETGTGKELVAQALHNSSRRYSRKFVSLNCSAIPSNLIESILFGTTKGSFTGAENKTGLFEQADGGTLFLDEINSLAPELQIKILQAVETKMIRRIGSRNEIYIDTRIIAASNEEPKKLIAEGKLKADLYYRLAVIYIELPRLAERGNDILVLADYYIRYFNRKMNTDIEPLGEELKQLFLEYTWPGNVRELRNIIESAIIFTESSRLTIEDLPDYIVKSCMSKDKKSKKKRNREILEREIISTCYEETGKNLKKTAELLGISSQLLFYKLKKYEEENYGT